ncbi:helix-turn-helix transcriptional regulator [Microbacterium sp. ru370.1]|uniref:helix-turn-helix transcriptional regulator n=1 Tax=Microbacterium sp. ru370.1 TaxID=1761809 RepID=UPI000B808F02|nr:helix-turn-helix transcriptional regulator [Microbacterium sp. ru370.1]
MPSVRHLALIAESEPIPTPAVWTDSAALTLATQFVARSRQDALGESSHLVSRYFDGVRLRQPASLSAGVRCDLYACVAEYSGALGWTLMGARFAAEARLFADTPALLYRTTTLIALHQAMNGEFAAADTEIRHAQQIFESQGWPALEQNYGHFAAEIAVATSRADVTRLREASSQMTSTHPDDPYWIFTAGMADVTAHLFAREFAEAFALSSALLHSSRRLSSHSFPRQNLLCLHSDILVARGEFAQALSLLEQHESMPVHGICLPSQRAASLLGLGREREVLAVTEACATDEDDHNLRIFVPLLVRRAVAFHRLGDTRRATQSFESALLLLGRAGVSLLPFVMLPHDEVRTLLDAVAVSRPALQDEITEIRRALHRVAAPPRAAPATRADAGLTAAERELAAMLPTPMSLPDIAHARGVSVNTIKSQARSIYTKLGVGGRRAAVEVLSRSLER